MVAPIDGEKLIANEVRRTYAQAELRVIETIVKEVQKPTPYEFGTESWASSKLAAIREVKGELDAEVIAYLKEFDDDVYEAVEEAYKVGQKAGEKQLAALDQKVKVKGRFAGIDQRKVEKLAGAAINNLNSTHLRILRQSDDVYRQVIARATEGVTVGVDTRRQASQRALNEFANRGITGFQDATGRSWNLSSYSEMAVRSASGQAAIEGNMQRLKDNGEDLVMVSAHGEECELCRPWEGKVLSMSGEDDKYPSVAEAEGDGLFHPNCAHNISAYIHGLTKTDDAEPDPEGAAEREQQRYNERQIRKWKRREKAALTDTESEKARKKVSEWQGKQRDFIDEKDRRREYAREQIDQAR